MGPRRASSLLSIGALALAAALVAPYRPAAGDETSLRCRNCDELAAALATAEADEPKQEREARDLAAQVEAARSRGETPGASLLAAAAHASSELAMTRTFIKVETPALADCRKLCPTPTETHWTRVTEGPDHSKRYEFPGGYLIVTPNGSMYFHPAAPPPVIHQTAPPPPGTTTGRDLWIFDPPSGPFRSQFSGGAAGQGTGAGSQGGAHLPPPGPGASGGTSLRAAIIGANNQAQTQPVEGAPGWRYRLVENQSPRPQDRVVINFQLFGAGPTDKATIRFLAGPGQTFAPPQSTISGAQGASPTPVTQFSFNQSGPQTVAVQVSKAH